MPHRLAGGVVGTYISTQAPGPLATMGGCQSGQLEQTVNLSAKAFGGSNPSPPTFSIAAALRLLTARSASSLRFTACDSSRGSVRFGADARCVVLCGGCAPDCAPPRCTPDLSRYRRASGPDKAMKHGKLAAQSDPLVKLSDRRAQRSSVVIPSRPTEPPGL